MVMTIMKEIATWNWRGEKEIDVDDAPELLECELEEVDRDTREVP